MSQVRTEDDVLEELREVGAAIAEAEPALAELFRRRLALFQEGTALDPPIVYRRLGEAAGVAETAVQAALRKAKKPS